MKISIKGLDKARLLQALFNHSKPMGLGFYALGATTEMTYDEAKKIVSEGKLNFDYVRGRVIHINISGDEINSSQYDRRVGTGAALMVIATLKKGVEVGFEEAKPINKMEKLAAEGKIEEAAAIPSVSVLGLDSMFSKTIRWEAIDDMSDEKKPLTLHKVRPWTYGIRTKDISDTDSSDDEKEDISSDLDSISDEEMANSVFGERYRLRNGYKN